MSSHRSPAVAGQFYAGTKPALEEQIEAAFEHPVGPASVPAVSTDGDPPLGLISPHAGYPYSGPVAAHGFSQLATTGRPEVAIIVGPNHGRRGRPLAISGATRWETPLGTVTVHDDLRERLSSAPGVEIDESTHAGEHSLEVQVPFLQYLYDDQVPILPIVMSRQDQTHVDRLTSALLESVTDWSEVVIIASTDLTHYEPAERAHRDDEAIRGAIESLDVASVMDAKQSGHSMCGPGPTAVTLAVAREQQIDSGTVLSYATSGETGGDMDSVVGYVSAVM
ncbi:AmmeMemoRadiSam system protein B [Halodesulfurarchaeum sp.]|uniref:AmmeMemoRadiSam system protein B n=1 Tax=Halodesulfurarchaeum sp. TaxID=1980530 RepID=UPI002FC37545